MLSVFRVASALRGSGRSGSRQHPGGTDAPTFEPETFEYFRVGSDVTLVRASGRLPDDERPTDVQLVIESGGRTNVFENLPEPDSAEAPAELWRLAFSVPAGLLDADDVSFALDLRGPSPLMLQAPVESTEPPVPVGDDLESASQNPPEPPPDRERDDRLAVEARLTEALGDLGDAQALVEQLERRCYLSERGLADFREKLVQAWGESNELRQLLDARERAHRESKEEARSRRAAEEELRGLLGEREQELATSRAEVESQCELLAAELATRATIEQGTSEEIEAAREREKHLREEGEAALHKFEEARAQAEEARAHVEDASRKAEEAEKAAASARGELSEVRALVSGAETAAEERAGEVEQREQELAAVREALTSATAAAEQQARDYEERTAALTKSEEKLRAELAKLQTKLEQGTRRRAGLRWKRTTPPEHDEAGSAELEAKVSELIGRIGELEQELVEASGEQASPDEQRDQLAALQDALAGRRIVEDDLRAMLESEKSQLATARDEVKVLRTRLADARHGGAPEGLEPATSGEQSWSALDYDLVDRLTKAKALAGGD